MKKLAILRHKFKDHNGHPKATAMNYVEKILAIRELNKKTVGGDPPEIARWTLFEEPITAVPSISQIV
jgi:hypothetical protein